MEGGFRDLGLSPRARGNRLDNITLMAKNGPIPAGAGEPWRRSRGPTARRAYPRGRGGTANKRALGVSRKGLSPRARGNPGAAEGADDQAGPIPAGAGEPMIDPQHPNTAMAYPRGRGGTRFSVVELIGEMGLSPRARGNRP